ncbi:MAG: EamA family transporter [Terracidiphilus sp.]|jgi:drug/metabolite transporter (DMT)-like permease
MNAGILMCVLGAISFGLLGCASKMAERKRCNASALVLWMITWASLFMLVRWLTQAHKVHVGWAVIALAFGFGLMATIAYLAFQRSIEFGKVTVGWLFMNLSAGVPALVSLWMYSEKLTLLKFIAFCLALISLFCLFQGNRLEVREATRENSR